MLENILAILFYGTLLLFIFIKIYNVVLVKKHNCKDLYKEEKNKIKQTKCGKTLRIISIISGIGLVIIIPYAITSATLSFAFMIVDKGQQLDNSLSEVSIIIYSIYFIFITYKLYVNILLNKYLQKIKSV